MITIRGIKLTQVTIGLDEDGPKVTGKYQVLTTQDKVLAKQGFNGYDEVKVEWSRETKTKLDEVLDLIKRDIQETTGIVEKEPGNNL